MNSLFKAFRYAFAGMHQFFKYDRNGKIHLWVTVLVTAAGFYFSISLTEWCLILLCVALVIGMEMMNHALEKLSDAVDTQPHPLIKIAKDVAAAAVLWCVIIAVIIGLMLFLPKIFKVII